jgi:hypothetical protein
MIHGGMKFISLFIVLATVWGAGTAGAQAGKSWIVHYDAFGLPRCLEDPDKFYAPSYLLVWRENRQYQREVFALPFAPLLYPGHCHDWRVALDESPLRLSAAGRTAVPLARMQSEGLPPWGLPAHVPKLLEQASLGANRPWPDPESLLDGLESYSREFNYEMSRRFGMEFTALLFERWLERQPGNRELRERILERHSTGSAAVGRRYRGVQVYVASGYLEPPDSSRVQAFVEDLKALGLQVHSLPQDSTDGVRENSLRIAHYLRGALARGERILLVGASKGAGEALGALAELGDTSGGGRILGHLNLSGTLLGSFLADWATGIVFPAVSYKIRQEARDSGVPLQEVWNGLHSQTTSYLEDFMNERKDRLIRGIPYFDVVGIASQDVYREESFVRRLRDQLLDTNIFPLHGANDGYLEYPAMVIPPSWGLWSRQIVFHASHMIYDGSFNGISMQDMDARRRLLAAMMDVIGEEMGL